MEILNQETIQNIVRLTWRNPAFMALFIALIWLIPQIIIRRVMSDHLKKRKLELQKEKIKKLYPKTPNQKNIIKVYSAIKKQIIYMKYKIVRIDGKEDMVTKGTYINYAEAYDLIDKLYGNICCSDPDDENIIYYEIVEK